MTRLFALVLLLMAGCDRTSQLQTAINVVQPSNDDLAVLSARLQRITSIILSDNDRDQRRFELSDIKRSLADEQAIRQFFVEAIATYEPMLHVNRFCSADERAESLTRNRRLEFSYDQQIPIDDLNAIVAFVEKYACIDARILSCRFIDENTVEITTGIVRGPLNGGGQTFMARHENGGWVVRFQSSWVS